MGDAVPDPSEYDKSQNYKASFSNGIQLQTYIIRSLINNAVSSCATQKNFP